MLCDICRTNEANIHIAGEGHYCCDCNNSRIAELYGINYLKQYAREVVIDDAQKRPHTFEIRNYLTPMYSEWAAIEQGDGYEFNVMTAPEDDQVAALVKLHRKIYAGLQHQSLKRDDSEFHLSNALQLEDGQYHLHQTGYGRIGYDPETCQMTYWKPILFWFLIGLMLKSFSRVLRRVLACFSTNTHSSAINENRI